MSWTEFHTRTDLLNGILAAAATEPDPLRLLDDPAVRQWFGSADGALLALHRRWSTHLAAKLDHAVEHGRPVTAVWHELAAEQPALRATLDAAARCSPAVRNEERRDRRMVAAHRNLSVADQWAIA